MGGEPLFALPPRVLVAGRLQCGAARAGVRRGRGECAELAHLAPRLHDWFYARHAEKRTFSEEVGRNTILAMSHRGKHCVGWTLRRYAQHPRAARPVEAPTSRFDSRGCPVHRHPRPRAEEAGRTSSTRLLQLAGVERLPRAMNEIWYQGSETPWSGRRVTRVVS